MSKELKIIIHVPFVLCYLVPVRCFRKAPVSSRRRKEAGRTSEEGVRDMRYGCQSMTGKIEAVLIKGPAEAFVSQEHLGGQWEAFGFLSCPDYEEALREYGAFERLLRDEVPHVVSLPRDGRTGLDSLSAHDGLKVTERGAIYFTTGIALRRGEGEAARDVLESLGVPTLGVIEEPGTMEGGDVVWLDRETVAIGRGYRTNDAAIEQFRALTDGFVREIVVVPLPHGEGEEACLHLMSLVSLVDRDLAVVYSRYLPVFFRRMLLDRGLTLLEVDDEEYASLGSNVLALAPRVCLVLEGNPRIRAGLEAQGCRVVAYEGRQISLPGTGGPTCLTHPLLRI